MALLAGLALAAAGVIAFAIEADRIGEEVTREIDQELDEFAALQKDAAESGTPFTDVQSLISTFLSRNVPDEDELLIGWWGGGPKIRSPRHPLAEDPSFVAFVRERIDVSGTSTYHSREYGELMVTVQPAQAGDSDSGALVIVTFLDLSRGGLHDTIRTYALVGSGLLILVAGLAWWQSGRLLAPLRTLRRTAEDITATDLTQRIPERGNDDLTALTRTVNDMLDRLEAGFEGQRRFLDDAGHELRTPLTVLRGHLELLDVGSPEEIAETKELLLDETDRMARLVGDLILLAKTRRPDFVHPAPTQIEPLLSAVLAKARALGDRDWWLDSVPELTVMLDEQRITQALLQLADNAVKHTEPDDAIGFGASVAGGDLVLWVADEGPGVPEADRELIFDRFGRGVVAAGDEGFGLGLSIVRAIAEAHGGTARVVPADPSGACFEVIIPLVTTQASAHMEAPSPEAPYPEAPDPGTQHAESSEEQSWPRS